MWRWSYSGQYRSPATATQGDIAGHQVSDMPKGTGLNRGLLGRGLLGRLGPSSSGRCSLFRGLEFLGKLLGRLLANHRFSDKVFVGFFHGNQLADLSRAHTKGVGKGWHTKGENALRDSVLQPACGGYVDASPAGQGAAKR